MMAPVHRDRRAERSEDLRHDLLPVAHHGTHQPLVRRRGPAEIGCGRVHVAVHDPGPPAVERVREREAGMAEVHAVAGQVDGLHER
jgi:hypothetical protein